MQCQQHETIFVLRLVISDVHQFAPVELILPNIPEMEIISQKITEMCKFQKT
jgi:hypothetical protein